MIVAYSTSPNLGNLLSYRKICKRLGPKVSSFLWLDMSRPLPFFKLRISLRLIYAAWKKDFFIFLTYTPLWIQEMARPFWPHTHKIFQFEVEVWIGLPTHKGTSLIICNQASAGVSALCLLCAPPFLFAQIYTIDKNDRNASPASGHCNK